jgi:diacylglycerol kinase (ATP)
MAQPFQFTGRVRSFRFAFAGLWTMLRTQHNAWVHAAATVTVAAAGLAVRLGPSEWALITLAVVAVWAAEAMNTALEFLADAACPEFHPLVKHAKDIAASAVLIAACGAAVVGLLVFGRRIVG